MFMVLNRWQLHPGMETLFQDGWSEIVQRNIEQYGAFGSRLHKADDGTWCSYTKWPSREHWEAAHSIDDSDQEARRKMLSAIVKIYPPLPMVPVLDHLSGRHLTEGDTV